MEIAAEAKRRCSKVLHRNFDSGGQEGAPGRVGRLWMRVDDIFRLYQIWICLIDLVT